MAKKTEKTCWMFRSPSGVLIPAHSGYTRRHCIEKVMSGYGPNWNWKKVYRNGGRAVRVRIREI